MNPVISILIPTRNRNLELLSLISIISRCDTSNVEFIISDNSDEQWKVKDVSGIKFIRPEKVLNMSENWNLLLQHAQGRYLTFLGDDDALIPSELTKLVSFASSCDSDIIWTDEAGFGWPLDHYGGNFFKVKYKKRKHLSLDKLRKKILCIKKNIDLPTPYSKVLFNKNILNEFNKKYPKKSFCSRIPDVSAAVKIALMSKSQEFYNHTVFISGSSKTSNGRLGINGYTLNDKFGFNNLEFNPYPQGEMSKLKQATPFGYIGWYEPYMESITTLGQEITSSRNRIAFKSVYFSHDPNNQKNLSLELWPRSKCTILSAYLLNKIFYNFINLILKKYRQYIMRVLNLLTYRLFTISITGSKLDDTSVLVKFLEESNVLHSSKRRIRIVLNQNNKRYSR